MPSLDVNLTATFGYVPTSLSALGHLRQAESRAVVLPICYALTLTKKELGIFIGADAPLH
jgi:hypothetical protein